MDLAKAISVIVTLGLIAPAAAAPSAMTAPNLPEASAAEIDLPVLLVMAADYCRKLESAVLDFICLEEIEEAFDRTLDRPELRTGRAIRKATRTLIYDYQCVRTGGRLKEQRRLLRENGRPRDEADAALRTAFIVYETPLIGPVGMFGDRVRPHFDYAVAGKEEFRGKPVIVVEAVPKRDATADQALYGKAWIDPLNGDIVRIEWNPNRVGRYEVFEGRGKKYGREPRLTLTSEFGTAKNGLRFPTRFVFEEAYVDGHGRAAVRSTTTVTYRSFKFFTVQVDVGS